MSKKVIETFIQKLVAEIKDYKTFNNELVNIPFIISVLQQNLDNEKFISFIEDIKEERYYLVYENINNWFCYGRIMVGLFDEQYDYSINIFIDEKNDGYCHCQPGDENYREDKECCGYNCDWEAPSFNIIKEIKIGSRDWQGTQHDYWEFEDNFYRQDEKLEKEKKEKERQDRISFLQKYIEEAEKELKILKKEDK